MLQVPSSNPRISVRRLFEEKHFEIILNYNIANLPKWRKFYPNHEAWIRRVIRELVDDSYDRIAFGGFFHDESTIEDELCCSVIVKKNPYTPYLEIKNLIILKDNVGSIETFRSYFQKLITHVKSFAEQRGYSNLAIELFNRNKEDRDLIKFFFENDFTIAGRQANRYNESDEIVFLTSEVEQVYGFDPYDNISASKWILSKYLKSDKPEKSLKEISLNCTLAETDENFPSLINIDETAAYTFYSGKKFQDKIEKKFNSKNCLLIIEEFFTKRNQVNLITEVISSINDLSQFFIFDYTKEIIARELDRKNKKIFNLEELKYLLYREKPNKLLRSSFEEIGGLLLISNPERFKFDEVNKLLESEQSFVYIKLGAVGQYLTPGMPLVFAYYPLNSNRTKLHIWGVGEIIDPANLVNLDDLREQDEKLRKTKITTKQISNTDGDLLFKYFRSLTEGEDNSNLTDSILWTKKEFDKHNRYNATKRIVYFYINEFINLNIDGSYIDVRDILDDFNYTDDIENVFDFYLKTEEIKKLKAILKKKTKRKRARPKIKGGQKIKKNM